MACILECCHQVLNKANSSTVGFVFENWNDEEAIKSLVKRNIPPAEQADK